MTQSQKIGAALVIGYLVYTVMNGNLPKWLCIFGVRRDCGQGV